MFKLTSLFDLSGRIALITGSSRGLGYAMAQGLAEAGATVILNGQNPDNLGKAAAEFAAQGLTVHTSLFNVTDSPQVKAEIARITAEIGAIDILVNNAGINYRQPFAEYDEDQWRRVIDINLNGVFYVSKAVVPSMIERKSGKIIHIASLMSDVSRKTIPAYTASKGAVKQLTKAMSTELAEHNIQVNAIAPGFFNTDLNIPLMNNPEFNNWVIRRTPAGRWGEPPELKGIAVFLASDASTFVNGQTIYVDGGTLAAL
jgi:gluconate 5-dehydrogenase